VTARLPPGAGDPLLTAEDVAGLTRVSLRTVRRWIAAGKLEVVPVGERLVRIRRSALEAFLRRCEREGKRRK
jgi:excisionase family DNA binding protein